MPFIRVVAVGIAKVFSKVFGLATFTFFGRVPTRDDDKVSLIGLLALIWLSFAVALLVPGVAGTMMPFLPDDDLVIRGASAAMLVLVPPGIGLLTTTLQNRREQGPARARQALNGYLYAIVLSLVVVALILVVPVVKASYILRRFELKHIAIMVKRGDYEDVLAQIRQALARHGIQTEQIDPNPVIWRIFAALAWIEGHIFRRDIDHHMMILRGVLDREGSWFEVTLHATDISVVGQKPETTRVMAALAEELDEQYLYFSWDDESQALEDRIAECQLRLERGEQVAVDEIRSLADELSKLALSEEEWNAIRRQIYRLERDHYRLRVEGEADELVR